MCRSPVSSPAWSTRYGFQALQGYPREFLGSRAEHKSVSLSLSLFPCFAGAHSERTTCKCSPYDPIARREGKNPTNSSNDESTRRKLSFLPIFSFLRLFVPFFHLDCATPASVCLSRWIRSLLIPFYPGAVFFIADGIFFKTRIVESG